MSTVTDHTRWSRGILCMTGDCVEVGIGATNRIRDSKQAHLGDGQPVIEFKPGTFDAFLDELVGVTEAGSNDQIEIERLADGDVSYRCRETDVVLRFSTAEEEAFVESVRLGQFRQEPAPA